MKNFGRKCVATAATAVVIAFGTWLYGSSATAQDSEMVAQEPEAAAARVVVRFPTRVVDSKNKVVGTYEPFNDPFQPHGILDLALLTINDTSHELLVSVGGFANTCGLVAQYYFSEPGCQGELLAMNGNSRGALALDEVGGTAGCVKDNVLYYPQRPFGDNAYASIGTGSDPGHVSQCTSSSGAIFSGPMATFDLTKLKLTPPFHLK